MIKCAGSIVTWDSTVDVISDQTAREIVKNNRIYDQCKSK